MEELRCKKPTCYQYLAEMRNVSRIKEGKVVYCYLTSSDAPSPSFSRAPHKRNKQLQEDTGAKRRPINTEVVRELLIAAFDDNDLMTLCFDRFHPVYDEKFASGMSKSDKVQKLLEYCVRQGSLEDLVKLVRERNPYQYSMYVDRILG